MGVGLVRGAIALCTCLCCFGAASAFAILPPLAVQGILHNQAGGPISDGDYAVTVNFYLAKDDVKPASNETVAVKVQGGLFATVLKVQLSDGAANFAYVGVSIGVEPELPRVALTSVLHAWHAGSADSAEVAVSAKAVQCSGCIGLEQLDAAVLQPYAKLAKLADIASSGAWGDIKNVPFFAKLADCAPGQVLQGFGVDGASHCVVDLNNKYDGTNFALSGKSCGVGEMVTGISASGIPVCAAAINVPKFGNCPIGTAIASIAADGSVSCNKNAFKLIAGPTDVLVGKSLVLTHNLNSLDVLATGWVDLGGGVWEAVQANSAGGAITNVAAQKNGGKCTAESTAYGGNGVDGDYGCNKALDGNYVDGGSTAWATKGEGAGAFMTITFDKSYQISAIGYMQRNCPCEWNKTLRLEYSDGTNVKVVLDNVQGPKTYALNPIVTSFVKIVVEDVYGTVNNGACEIEIMGTASSSSLRLRKTINTVEILNQTGATQKLQLVVAP